jgi:mannose-6-phosphate isomerase-like protein (cupin superfamily)
MSTKLLSVVLLAGATAFAAKPPVVTYYSAAELQQMGQRLGTKLNGATFASDNLEKYTHSYTMLAHREGTGSAEVHEHDADLFLVVAGDATLVTGGKIVKPHTEKAGEIRGGSIEGGQRQKLSAGDVVHIAPNVPHQLLIETGKPFTYFVMKVSD